MSSVADSPWLGHKPHVIEGESLGKPPKLLRIRCPETIPSIPEFDLMTRVSQLVAPSSKAFVDVGSHCGFWSLMFADRFESVYAIEPAQYQFELLVRNVKFNSMANITPIRLALSDSEGLSALHVMGMSGGNNMIDVPREPPMRTEQVSVTMLDRLALPQIGMIKIDVEGHEYEVLKGSMKTIERDRPVLVIESDPFGLSRDRVKELLAALSYVVDELDKARSDMLLAVPQI